MCECAKYLRTFKIGFYARAILSTRQQLGSREDQCRYILLTTGCIDERHRGAATLSVNANLFEKRRIVHLSYIDTRRIREGSQSANNGTVDVLSWQLFL